jgi:6-phosphogluconolactonase (cycloisomerase 2 family)
VYTLSSSLSCYARGLATFTRDPVSGALTYASIVSSATGSSLAISPDGANLYVTQQETNKVTFYRRDAATGVVTSLSSLTDGTGGVDGLGGAVAVTVAENGLFAIVAAATDDAVTLCSRDPADGRLVFQGTRLNVGETGGTDCLDNASAAAISPDGTFVYVTAQNSKRVVAFKVAP